MRVLVFPLLLLMAALAPAFASAGNPVWSVDAQVELIDESHARMATAITYDATHYSRTWRLSMPPGATFVKAEDAEGSLRASVADATVTVETRGAGSSYTFTLVYALTPREEGAFRVLKVHTSADAASPTSVRLTLPTGWSLAAWDGADNLERGRDGAWRAIGPTFLDVVALKPGHSDPGPDPRVQGTRVLRDVVATVQADHLAVNVTQVYDTHVYGPWWNITLPHEATHVAASSPFGPLDVTFQNGIASVQAPYPFHAGLGARPFSLLYRVPLDSFGGGFQVANVSLRAGVEDPVTLRVVLPEDAVRAGASATGGEATGPLSFASTGPMHARVTFLPAPPAGSVRFQEGPFVVQVPGSHEAAGRATARAAAELLPEAAAFSGDALNQGPLYVVYTDAPVFEWEEGFYRPGTNSIAIRLDNLPTDSDEPHIAAVTTLVHEATHGLVDRLMPEDESDLSWLKEGLSRLAEMHVERAFPDQVVHCDGSALRTSCTRQSIRMVAEDLQAFHQRKSTFDPAWSTREASEAERKFLYDYSGLVFAAYERSAPEGALAQVLRDLATSPMQEDPEERAREVIAALLARAPGLTEEQLLYPGREHAALPPAQFRAQMGDLLAPPYPFESDALPIAAGGGFGSSRFVPLPAWLPFMVLALAGAAVGLREKRK